MESIDLPIDYGVKCSNDSMLSSNDLIYDILHENDEFSQEFIDKMARMEKENS